MDKRYCSECEYYQIRYSSATCNHSNNIGQFVEKGDYENPPKTNVRYIKSPWKRNKKNNCSYYKKGTPQPSVYVQ